ncbi:GntR family transcriptional regulator [Kribbella speibonae]|uniref:GntR family transcriptional regulator n=1 Tax=Kribbella speibonae TaxID=1572660 RepID=UPI00192E03F5|nr:GntR family transcriptional regulator [Kribbella speibonae]
MTANRTTAADRAHAGIKDGIIKAKYPPGSMLSENELAAELEMSRTPVRSALARLQDEGWVTIYPQRGALVRDFTAEEMRESADFLHALETAGIQRADSTRRQAMAKAQEHNLAAQHKALTTGDYAGFAQLATEFHRAFVEVAGNSIMLAAYDRLRERQNMVIAKSGDRLAKAPADVVAEHRSLMEHARDGDWDAFSNALYAHLSLNDAHDAGTRPTLH